MAARANPSRRANARTVADSSAAVRGRASELGVGLGLRTVHYAEILERSPEVGFFEILSDNFMNTRGRPLEILDRVAERYPLVMHGVSLSIGSTDPLDWEYVRALRDLRERTSALWISDHLCWTGVSGRNTHDLLPLPFTEEAVRHVAARVRAVQDFLGARLVLENPSSYLEFAGTPLREWEFVRAVLEESDAELLLDVNNVFVSAQNHGFDADEYLRALPMQRVRQIHVAGHTHYGTHVVDTHVGPVPDAVWALLGRARELGADAPVLLEWDADIPPFDVVHAEARRAERALVRGAA